MKKISILVIAAVTALSLSACEWQFADKAESTIQQGEKLISEIQKDSSQSKTNHALRDVPIDLGSIPEFTDKPYVEINGNQPFFTEDELSTSSSEFYSELDDLGRCGVCYACIGTDIMPTEERGAIGMVKPSGWQISKYDFVDGKYLYNRCHLIGYQLSGENANERNLITGTRYLNVVGMLPYENEVAGYVKHTNNHVMYRVTPIFKGDNLVASGVLMEAKSVEDNGASIMDATISEMSLSGAAESATTPEQVG